MRLLVILHDAKGLTGGEILKLIYIRRTIVYAILFRFKKEDHIDSIPQKRATWEVDCMR